MAASLWPLAARRSYLVDLNDEAVRTFGWSRQELLGQPVDLLVPKTQRDDFRDRMRRCCARETIRNVECVQVTKAGKALNGLLTFSLLADEQGEPEAVAMIAKFVNT